jgi:HEAT repeat protein
VRYPTLFGEEDAQRLAERLARETEPSIRASLERAAGAVDPELAQRYAREAEEAGRRRHGDSLEAERKLLAATELPDLRAADLMRVARAYGRGATQLLADYLEDPAPLVREYAAHALAEHGGPSGVEPLRAALGRETDTNAAMAEIYALGAHADAEAIPLLTRRLSEPALERAAIHAIARVGTPAARAALEAHARRASAETQDLIANLLKEEFAERP